MRAVGNPYAILGDAVIILLANWTLGAMPNEFAKQKGLWAEEFLGRDETKALRRISHGQGNHK